MQVREVMSSEPQYTNPEAPLSEIAQQMREQDFGFIPVGLNDRLIGTITDRDIITRGLSQGNDLSQLHARDVMTEKVLYCYENDDVDSAAHSMAEQQVHRLIVLNKDKRMTGIISLGDLAKKWHHEKECGECLKEISED